MNGAAGRPNEFAGTGVVVTGVGASGQAGAAVARAFAGCGAHVHCVDRSSDVALRARELIDAGWNATAHQLDLTDAEAVARAAEAIAAHHDGRIRAVAAVAGGFAPAGLTAESDPSLVARMLAVNLTTAYATARAFASSVRAARGAFVFVTSAATNGGRVAGLGGYAMAKGGVAQLVRALAQEEHSHGVRVNAVAPTALRTAANTKSMDGVEFVSLEEFAYVIVALCSSAFARVSGQCIEMA